MDYMVIIAVLLLFAIGLVALYSASGEDLSDVKKQMMWFTVSIVIVVVLLFIDYNTLGKFWIFAYIAMLIALILVLFTKPINGARSWFVIGKISIQPGELAKIVMIVCLAKVIHYFKEKDELNKPLSLLAILVFVAVPFVLIVMQPDYGTAMVFLVIAAVMLFVAGLDYKYILGAIGALLVILPLAYFFILPQHAKNRLIVFLNPQIDPRGIGYNVIQSKLAIGSGQFWGMGLFNGNQTQLGFLPIKTTDFIFSVIGEEMGFLVSALVVLLFIILMSKAIYIAKTSKDLYGTLLGAGVFALLLAHVVENIGMTMGLLPITGIPLPFISYGGSSLLTNMIAIGILLNVSASRQKVLFLG